MMAQSENEEEAEQSEELRANTGLMERLSKKDKGNLGIKLLGKKTEDGFVYSFNIYWTGAGLLMIVAVVQLILKYLV